MVRWVDVRSGVDRQKARAMPAVIYMQVNWSSVVVGEVSAGVVTVPVPAGLEAVLWVSASTFSVSQG
jgi:hypothetical protein